VEQEEHPSPVQAQEALEPQPVLRLEGMAEMDLHIQLQEFQLIMLVVAAAVAG
jgi:hypothetical protein